MSYELIFKEEASFEIVESYRWYESRRPGLGESFLKEIEKYLNLIQKSPALYPTRYNSKRAAVLKQFPYLIVYELVEQQVIVFAVFNTSRNPDSWKERTTK